MKIKPIILTGVLLTYVNLSSAQVSQTSTSTMNAPKSETSTLSPKGDENGFSPLKPKDANPYVFSSENDKKEALLKKREALINEIKRSNNDPDKVRSLREDLWRLENSIIRTN